jgi:ABC-type glycerol-3-phosphate transport system substrate-binding protein
MKLARSLLLIAALALLPTFAIGQTLNLDQARKEGEVVLYSTISVGAFNELNKAIKEKYPFLNVRHIRLGPAQQLAKIIQEQRAGQFLADVAYNNLLHLIYLKAWHSRQVRVTGNQVSPEEAIDSDGFGSAAISTFW